MLNEIYVYKIAIKYKKINKCKRNYYLIKDGFYWIYNVKMKFVH